MRLYPNSLFLHDMNNLNQSLSRVDNGGGTDRDTIASSGSAMDRMDHRHSSLIDQQSSINDGQSVVVDDAASRPLSSHSSRYDSSIHNHQPQGISQSLPLTTTSGISLTSSTSSGFLSSILSERFNNHTHGSSSSQLSSITINQRFNKLIKLEKKKLQRQRDLMKEIQNWSNILTDDECKNLLINFIKMLELEMETSEILIKKRGAINLQLLNVNKREKRTNDLKLKRNKIMVKLRDNENKIGDSPITTLTRENLEELECSLQIVHDQFIRIINNGLKNSLADYILSNQFQSLKINEASKLFLTHHQFTVNDCNSALGGESGANSGGMISGLSAQSSYIHSNPSSAISSSLNSPLHSNSHSKSLLRSLPSLSNNNNLQRLILQNKLNNGIITRDQISTSASTSGSLHSKNQDFYIPLSPNKVGKYLDNKYNNDSEDDYEDEPDELENNERRTNSKNRPNIRKSSYFKPTTGSTMVNISNADLKLKATHGNPTTTNFYHSIQAGPPPTASSTINNDSKHRHSSSDNDQTQNIINHYSTPGSLGIRPISQTNHEWT